MQFILAETLRDKFDPRKIVKLEFRGIPDTEEEYDIRCEILCRAPVRLFQPRFSFKSVKTKKPQPSTGVVEFTVSGATSLDLADHEAALRVNSTACLFRGAFIFGRSISRHISSETNGQSERVGPCERLMNWSCVI